MGKYKLSALCASQKVSDSSKDYFFLVLGSSYCSLIRLVYGDKISWEQSSSSVFPQSDSGGSQGIPKAKN